MSRVSDKTKAALLQAVKLRQVMFPDEGQPAACKYHRCAERETIMLVGLAGVVTACQLAHNAAVAFESGDKTREVIEILQGRLRTAIAEIKHLSKERPLS